MQIRTEILVPHGGPLYLEVQLEPPSHHMAAMTPSTIRVLLIEDEESDYLITQALLGQIEGQGTELEWASSYNDGLRILQERRHDVCLLDYFLDEGTGLELMKQARSLAIRTPIVLLTGKGNRSLDIEAMRSGAVDYLEKANRDPELLERALRYAVERHRAQEALRQSEERHRGMFDQLPIGLFRVTEEGEYMEANPALIRTLEFPEREGIREAARSFFVSPGDREEFLQTLSIHGVVLGFETALRTAAGRLIYVRTTARAHRGPAGAIEYVEGLVEDVSSLRKSREPSPEAAAFRVLMAASREGILVVAADGRVLKANPRAQTQLRTTLPEMSGTAIWDYFGPADGVAIAGALEEIAGGRSDSVALTVRMPSVSGQVQARFFPILDPAGDVADKVLLLLDEGNSEAGN